MAESPGVQSKGKAGDQALTGVPRVAEPSAPGLPGPAAQLPLYDHFPALAALPRVALGSYPSPIERVELAGIGALWLKRDDQNAPVAAGNKVRALEFLLGRVRPGDTVLTAGGDGSTHVYATAVHAARLGARTVAIRWRHDMHPEARDVAAAAAAHCAAIQSDRWPALAILRIGLWRAGMRAGLGAPDQGVSGRRLYVPIGGSSPLGVLGHVSAGLELAEQIAAGQAPEPTHVVVPLGSGGTAAGLAIGFGIAGMRTVVVAARVAPRTVANITRIRALIRRTLGFLRAYAEVPSRRFDVAPVVVDHTAFGGAYGRPLAAGARAATLFRALYDSNDSHATPPVLDATYSAKAAAVAVAMAERGPGATCIMLWTTFDGRVVGSHTLTSGACNREPL